MCLGFYLRSTVCVRFVFVRQSTVLQQLLLIGIYLGFDYRKESIDPETQKVASVSGQTHASVDETAMHAIDEERLCRAFHVLAAMLIYKGKSNENNYTNKYRLTRTGNNRNSNSIFFQSKQFRKLRCDAIDEVFLELFR